MAPTLSTNVPTLAANELGPTGTAISAAGAQEAVLANPSMGIGLNGVADWSTQMPFIDVFKSSRPWTGHLEGRWGGATSAQIEAVSDVDGYLTRLPAGVSHVSALFLTEMPAQMTSIAGTYRITYEGQGDITVNGATNVRYGNGEIWFDYTPRGNNLVSIDIHRINSADHIRDISVVHEKNIAAFEEGKIFNPDWIKLIDDMRSLRFMDWQSTNNSDVSTWADRAHASDATWGNEAGVPLEIMVQLANETGTDPWFNIPHLATQDYIRNFVTYVKANLDPDLKPFFEYSNEVWNWQFGQAQWAHREGQKLWPNQGDAWVQYYGMKAAEMATIIDQVYGPDVNDQVNKVIATHTAWQGLEWSILEAPNAVRNGSEKPASLFNNYAVTGYFDGSLGREKAPLVLEWIARSEAAATAQGRALGLSGTQLNTYIQQHKHDQAIGLAIRELRDGSVTGNADGSIANLVKSFAYHKKIADAYGLTLVMYEGGTHVVGVGEWGNNRTLSDFFLALNQSDDMGQLYLELLSGWKNAGGTLFNAFVDVGRHGTHGSWGALQHLDDHSERWDALVAFNRNNPGWWENRGGGDFIGTGETAPGATDPAPPTPVGPAPGDPRPVDPAPAPTDPRPVGSITGTNGNDTLNGGSANDTIFGLGGNDTIDGKGGADTMHGGTGDDVYFVDHAGDRTIEKAGEGYDWTHAFINWTLADNVEALSLRSAANINGTGNALDNVINGNSGNNIISGLGGNDTLVGHGGNDVLIGGKGNDRLTGGLGKDMFRFAAGDGQDTITDFAAREGEVLDIQGHSGLLELRTENGGTRVVLSGGDSILLEGVAVSDLSTENFLFNGMAPRTLGTVPGTVGGVAPPAGSLVGTAANDVLNGTAANDRIYGLGGNDTIDGKGGADEMHGGTGNDVYWVDNSGDRTIERAGEGYDWTHASINWTLADNVEALSLRTAAHINGTGNALDNFINGNSGNNVISGLAGNDILEGRGGNDRLLGGSGSDTLNGGEGTDIMFGGVDRARDTFIFNAITESRPGSGRDIVHDFLSGVDQFDLRGIDANTMAAGNQAFRYAGSTATAHSVWAVKSGADLLLRGDVSGDKMADFEVLVTDIASLITNDFLL